MRTILLVFVTAIVACSEAPVESTSSIEALSVQPIGSVRLRQDTANPVVVPGKLTVSDSTYLLVDPPSKDVKVFARTGAFIRTIGRPGRGPAEFTLPVDVGTDVDGNVYVLDRAEDRVTRFGPDGQYLGDTRLQRGGSYTSFSVLPDGRFAIAGRAPDPETPPRDSSSVLHIFAADGSYETGHIGRPLPQRPLEVEFERYILAASHGSICVFSQVSNTGYRYSFSGDIPTELTLSPDRYRPVKWLPNIPSAGAMQEVRDWWDQQVRIAAVAANERGDCFVQFIDPSKDQRYLGIARLNGKRYEAPILSDSIGSLSSVIGDTVFGLNYDEATAQISVTMAVLEDLKSQ